MWPKKKGAWTTQLITHIKVPHQFDPNSRDGGVLTGQWCIFPSLSGAYVKTHWHFTKLRISTYYSLSDTVLT